MELPMDDSFVSFVNFVFSKKQLGTFFVFVFVFVRSVIVRSSFRPTFICYPFHPDQIGIGMWLLYDSVGMTNRTPIAFQSHTNRTMKVEIEKGIL